METAEDPSGGISALAHPMNQQCQRRRERGPGLFLGSTSSLAGNVKYFPGSCRYFRSLMNQPMQSTSFSFALSASTDPPVSCLSWGAYYEGWLARRRKLRWIITLSIYRYSAAYSERGGTKPAPWILNIRCRDPVPVIAWDQWGKLKPNARKKITIDIGVPVIQSCAVSRIHRNEKHVTHNYRWTDESSKILYIEPLDL